MEGGFHWLPGEIQPIVRSTVGWRGQMGQVGRVGWVGRYLVWKLLLIFQCESQHQSEVGEFHGCIRCPNGIGQLKFQRMTFDKSIIERIKLNLVSNRTSQHRTGQDRTG